MSLNINPKFISTDMATDAEVDAASILDRDRSNHTGTQAASTISDFTSAAQAAVQSELNGKVSYSDMQKTSLAYVSPNGSDTIGDGSYAKPYQTIAKAITETSDGDTIFLFTGLYTESKITIPSGTGSRSFKSFSSATTEIQNGFSHTASVGNVGFSFDSINLNSIELDETLATNGLISLTKCAFSFTRSDNNQNVLVTATESTIPSGTIDGGSNTFNECLFISNITLNNGLVYFENSKFVAPVLAHGQSTARMLDCSLFGATEFISGTIVGGNTPTWEVDLSTEYTGGYTGDINKVILSNAAPLGFTPEDVANKSTNTSLGTSDTLYPSQNAVKQYVDDQVNNLNNIDIGLDTRLIAIEDSQVDAKEPTGHVNRAESTMSFDEVTRTLSISPVSTSFAVYIKGTKLNISSTLTSTIPDTSGNYFFYIDANGNLDHYFGFNPLVLTDVAYTAFVHWNATINQAVAFGEERHGITMDGTTHSYLHTTRGTQLVSGAAISYTLGDGSSASDSEIGIANLQLKDEDITANIVHSATPSSEFEQVLSPIAYIPVHYRDGSEWVRATTDKYPMLYGTSRAKYNYFNGSTWSLVESGTNGKVLVSYIFGTTNITEPVIALLGQDEYATLEDAKSLAAWDKITFGDLPAQEMKLLYIVYYETSSAFSNDPKSKIIYVSDVRFSVDRQVSASVFNGAHGNLSGLENDDHPQYHTDARGDIRYYLKSEVDSAISSASTSDRDRANHTGTQLASTISDFTSAVQAVTIDAAKIDGGSVSNAEFATLDGITTGVSIQSQIDGKQATITGGATTITSSDLTINRALHSNASGKVAVSATTATELGYVSGVTSAIQTQLNGKEPSISAGTTSQYWRGDKSFQTLDKAAVGLANVDNTADTNKVIAGDVTGTLGASTVVKLQNRTLSATAPLTNQVVKWDGSQWAPAYDIAWTSNTVANSTLSLTSASNRGQIFTGTVGGQIVNLPDATTLVVGDSFSIINGSDTLVILRDSSSVYKATTLPSRQIIATLINNANSVGTWIFSDPTLELNDFELYDDFISANITTNQVAALGWTIAGTGQAYQASTGASNGVIRLSTANTASAVSALSLGTTLPIRIDNSYTFCEMRVSLPALGGGGANQLSFHGGLLNAVTNTAPGTNPLNAIGFTYDGSAGTPGVFTGFASSAAATTTVASVVTPTANTFYKLSFLINAAGTVAHYYVNNAFIGSISTNMPTAIVMAPAVKVNSGTANNAAKTLDIDFYRLQKIYATPR